MSTVATDQTLTAYFIPLSVIALWPTPNYTNPVTRQWIVPYVVTLEIISTLSVVGRIYARYFLPVRQFGADDLLIVLAWIFATLFSAAAIYGVVSAGVDRHIWDVDPRTGVRGGFIAWLNSANFLLTTSMTKISILIFQRRLINRSNNRAMNIAINTAIIFTILYFGTFISFLIFSCSPTSALWTSLDINNQETYKCLYRGVLDPLAGALSVFSDLYALVIPEIVISRLQMQKRQKVILYGIFGCGLIVIGAGLARTVWLARLWTDPRRDITWIGYEILVWTELEMQFGIVCASAPALKLFFGSVKTATSRTRTTDIVKSLGTAGRSYNRNTLLTPILPGNSEKKGMMATERLSLGGIRTPGISTFPPEEFHKGKRVLGIDRT